MRSTLLSWHKLSHAASVVATALSRAWSIALLPCAAALSFGCSDRGGGDGPLVIDNPEGCPAQWPAAGAPAACGEGLSCRYPGAEPRTDCADPPLLRVTCSADGGWLTEYPVACEAPAMASGCAPFGVWAFTFSEQERSSLPCQVLGVPMDLDAGGELSLRLGEDGVPRLAFYAGGHLDPSSCQLEVTGRSTWSNPSENGGVDWRLSLEFDGSSVSGAYSYTGFGYCPGSGSARLAGMVR